MRYRITHHTTYAYEQPVVLMPHYLRLRPRCQGDQSLVQHQLAIKPQPLGLSSMLDAEGNAIAKSWWSPHPIDHLQITATSDVITHCTNPFAYVLEPWATHLPLDYPMSMAACLQADLHPTVQPLDPVVTELAQEICQAVNGNVSDFLMVLNQRIYAECAYQVRPTGTPWPAGYTWTHKTGSCRDLVGVFMVACRAVGLAARFVSGYEQGDPGHEQTLHAWAEVYLPGAGWRGYDPTHGLVVCDRHVAVAASAWPAHTAPVTGGHHGGQRTAAEMTAEISIQPL